MSDALFDRGLKVRREVVGDEYVKRSLESADEFTMPLQQLATKYCWGDIAGIKLVHVPYKGSSEAQAAVLGQQVALAFDTMSAVPHVKAGKLRPLAASSMQRIAAFPDLPTMNELGYKNFDIGFWSGIFVPKNTPPAVIEKLNRAIVEMSKDPAIRPKLEMHGTIVTSSPEEFRAHIKTETSTLAEVIRRANISVQ